LRNFIDWGSVHTGTVIEQEDKKRGQGGRIREESDMVLSWKMPIQA
jgi:hypothetical protein